MKRRTPQIADADPRAQRSDLQGRILLGRGQYLEAETILLHARDQLPPATAVPHRAMLWTYLAEAQLAQGKVDSAAKTQQILAREMPGLAAGQLLSARVHLARGDYTAGIAELQRLLAAAPDFVQARMMLGAALLSQGNFQQAENQLAQVVDRAPDNIEARKLLARVRLQLDRPDAALRVLTPALEEEGSDPQLYSLAGAAQLRSGNSEEALTILEKNVRLHPADEAPRLDMASAYVSARRYAEALEVLKGAPGQATPRRAALIVMRQQRSRVSRRRAGNDSSLNSPTTPNCSTWRPRISVRSASLSALASTWTGYWRLPPKTDPRCAGSQAWNSLREIYKVPSKRYAER
jgi:tetratricopeptide (TPR) repeat protein